MPEMLRYKRQNKTNNRGNKMKKKGKIPDFVSKNDKERLLKIFPDAFMSAIDWSVVNKIKEKDNE